ncbi:melanoma cell adhesion molecule b isoform X1 [Thunnus albacares]|uniref:melanoma cell adhesion molecule b isoform X1 n=1 Tax=Thunnus albacares TaxID=8236 RepID=UPI001CF7041C|nr:melanoma cell adhesion molecule b isoform X1 [Thunnus albacares]
MAVRDIGALLVGLLVLFHTWGAWALVEVNMEDRVEVFRGETAQITCMFTSDDGIGGVFIQWFYVTGGERQRIYYQDSTMKVVDRGTRFTDRISVNGTGATGGVVLTIMDVQLKDELEFICLVKGLTDGVAEGRTKLKVFVIPDHPIIEGVQEGISIDQGSPSKIATCKVKNGYPKPNITWYRNNMPLQSNHDGVMVVLRSTVESSGLFSVESELSITVKKEDKDAKFYCEATYFVPAETRMTESNFTTITVYYPSTEVNMWVESPKGKIKEGDSIELHCYGNGNKPSSAFSIRHKENEMQMDSNMLVLNNVTRLHSGEYTCVCLDTDTYEEISKAMNLSVNYLDAAVVRPKDSAELAQGAELTATCNALSSLETQTTWFKDGQQVSKGHTLTLKDATFNAAGTYMCVVTVPEIDGMETSGTLHVYVQSPPEIIRPDNTEIEESLENTVDLSCHVRGFPTPSVTWTTSDGKVLKTVSQQEIKEGVLISMVNFKVTSDITAFCNASNEYGSDSVAFNIKATTHTTTPATTTTTTTTTTTSSTTTTISSTTVKGETAMPPKKIKKESSGVIIAVIIICILLLAVLGSVLYFLYKKGKICGRSGKQDLTKEKSNKDNIVVEMKSDNTEEAVLLGVNGEKQP